MQQRTPALYGTELVRRAGALAFVADSREGERPTGLTEAIWLEFSPTTLSHHTLS